MKYIFRRNGRCWHIVRSTYPVLTTGLVTFCYERILIPDYMDGRKFKDDLFHSKDVIQAVRKVPPVNPKTLERLYPPDAELDLTGRLCRECKRRFQQSRYADEELEGNLGDMRPILMAEIK